MFKNVFVYYVICNYVIDYVICNYVLEMCMWVYHLLCYKCARVCVCYCRVADLHMFVIPTGLGDSAAVNLTDWLRNATSEPASDSISIYQGLVLRRLQAGAGLVITAGGNTISNV
jgi:hypothetical protein